MEALDLIPRGTFILTSAFGDARGGVIARWIQRVSSSPPMVMVAIEKGQPLSPVIRDSRRFAVCQLGDDDRVLRRLFDPERGDPFDPFLGLPTMSAPGGVPVPLKAIAWLDCELTRHLDVEGNCELYIGLIHAGGVLRSPALGTPAPGATRPIPPIPGRDEPAFNESPTAKALRAMLGAGEAKPANGNGHGTAPTRRRPTH